MPENPRVRQLKVLIADDELGIRTTLRMIFEMRGHQVLVAETGDQAVEMALEHKPDVVLSDIMMPPGMSGIHAGIIIQENLPESRILLFSGHADAINLIEQAQKRGYHFEILAKPVLPEVLIGRVENTLLPVR